MTATPGNQVSSPLSQPVATLQGVGPQRAAQLARLNIFTIEDLLLHRPRRYEDRRRFRPIVELELNVPVATRGRVADLGVKLYRQGRKSVFTLVLTDGTARLHCRWWNLPFMERYFHIGDEVVVFGKPGSLKPRTIDHPEIETIEGGGEDFIHLNRITPVYPLTEGLPQRWLRALIWRTLEQFESKIAEPWPPRLQVAGCALQVEPSAVLEAGHASAAPRHQAKTEHQPPFTTHTPPFTTSLPASFPSRAGAVRMLHFPETLEDAGMARQRLALDEFTELQLQIQKRRQTFEAKSLPLPCGGDNRLIKPFLAAIGFKLTGAQAEVLREIRADLRGAHPMRRLLQGDVGSGKTVVAACAALMAIESGYAVALMAPTEILAEQHFRNFGAWFRPLGVPVELRTGSRRHKEEGGRSKEEGARGREEVSGSLFPGPFPFFPTSFSLLLPPSSRPLPPSPLTIGTHALIASGFAPDNLGLVVIDEQHKFGVTQREELVRKGRYPHLLVMTATPIPRTLGLTVYGDLDISCVRQSPPGRGRMNTFVRHTASLPKVWSFVRAKLAEGRQAYVVYPRVEDTGRNGIKAVTREYDALRRQLAPFQVGLLHGRMRPRDQDDIMAGFRANTIRVLLATSLIEVGVDVPNATVMIIENAEQFGLAQLHQLRGRIGRAAHDSYCILISPAANREAQDRLKILQQTTDGFRIAEADLELRGPGELLGPQQSGRPAFRFGDLAADTELLELARNRAREVLKSPASTRPPGPPPA